MFNGYLVCLSNNYLVHDNYKSKKSTIFKLKLNSTNNHVIFVHVTTYKILIFNLIFSTPNILVFQIIYKKFQSQLNQPKPKELQKTTLQIY